MTFFADLHIHSKFSRATSPQCDLVHLSLWARKKGVAVLGTGDFTHPAWWKEIQEKLVPAEPGLFRLRPEEEQKVEALLGSKSSGSTRFLLEVEISTIYKKGEKTRKVHHLLYAPDLGKAQRLVHKLSRIGNLASDGRPILGLDSRDLLEITLESGEGCYLIPAHIWTPWFSAMGSKSGFDSIEECYGDLAPFIFALETGLSSDPWMNRRLSSLDRYTLVSNSDAHSPSKIAREASLFTSKMDYFSILEALKTGKGYGGTVEFFPEEGKYHLDGHRHCQVRLTPQETLQSHGLCPVCGKGLTVGVLHRVEALADRPQPQPLKQDPAFSSFIPLPEIVAEIEQAGLLSKKVQGTYEKLLTRLGPELEILGKTPLEDIQKASSSLLAEGIKRMRKGQVLREAGYDGAYGKIRLFTEKERETSSSHRLLFSLPEPVAKPSSQQKKKASPAAPSPELLASSPIPKPTTPAASSSSSPLLDQLDPEQRAAAEIIHGPLLIIAGPGTGKTRTLTHRIAHLITHHAIPPEQCLAITFTRRAAEEMKERLEALLAEKAKALSILTFHALGLRILQEQATHLDLPTPLHIADEVQSLDLLHNTLGFSSSQAKTWRQKIAHWKRSCTPPSPETEEGSLFERYQQELHAKGWVDFEDLIALPVQFLSTHPDLLAHYHHRYSHLSIDEYQDIDPGQYRLIQLLVSAPHHICAIGDPDQAIYGFRGADVRFFQNFHRDFPQTRTISLTRNYRSTSTLVQAAVQAIAPSSLVHNRKLDSVLQDHQPMEIHECAHERAEAQWVVTQIEKMMGGSSFLSLDSRQVTGLEAPCFSFADFAILYRTTNQADVLAKALAHSGLPFQKKSHDRLADHPRVQGILDTMEQDEGPLAERLERALALPSQPLSSEASLAQPHEIFAWKDALLPLAQRWGSDFLNFRHQLALGVDIDLWDPRADRISLLTLHASKGLEFSVVFLVGCEQGVLPLFSNSWQSSDALNEERRLFFVGITRAKTRLFLSHAKKRWWRGEIRSMILSPFVTPIQEKLLQRHQQAAFHPKPRSTAHQLELFSS